MAASADDSSPFVFAVGCPRSGTTLLQRMLDAHPELTVTNDTHFVPRVLEKHVPEVVAAAAGGTRVPLTAALVDAVTGYHRFRRLGVTVAEARALAVDCDDYASFVSRLYAAVAGRAGKRLAGEKTPDFVRRLPLLLGLFPRSRVVHIVRDGRDTALSLLGWANADKGPGRLDYWRTDPTAVAALWWRWQVETGQYDGARLPSSLYYELRYEDLVAAPEAEAERLCAFLGLSPSAAMTQFHRGKERRAAGVSAKQQWLPPTRGLRNWRSEMPADDALLFDALCGDLLDRLGYARAGTAREVERVCGRADRARAWFEGWRAERQRKERWRRAGGGEQLRC